MAVYFAAHCLGRQSDCLEFCLYSIAHCFWSADTQSFLLLKLYKQFYTLSTVSHSIVNHFILYAN